MAILKKTKKKVSARRQQVRNNIATEQFEKIASVINSPYPKAGMILALFVLAATVILGIDTSVEHFYIKGLESFKPWPQILSLLTIVSVISAGMAMYIYHYQWRIIQKTTRAMALGVLFLILLVITRAISAFENWQYLAVGTTVGCAIVLTIAYDQRFAIGMTTFYALLACFGVDQIGTIEILMVMTAGALCCCFSLREIRTRMKLIYVSIFTTIVVFLSALAVGFIQSVEAGNVFQQAGIAALATFVVGTFIQAFLPIIESAFGIATSMTLLDYSDANQPLLKKLAMDAPGTFSHSLLIGSIAETAAESIDANGLLCRVGAYYHDIGKINKPSYFIENQMGSASRHDQLSPAMSQLVIVGHVKDGIEIAKEFGLPAVLRQFIETHHGTTLMEYFYHEAKKKAEEKQSPVSEGGFRYPGPKPKSREAAIVMLSDAVESATRSLPDHTPAKVESLVHSIAMKRLQDGQFDECDLTLRELSRIEASLSKSLAAHHHGRIAYPKSDEKSKSNGNGNSHANGHNGNKSGHANGAEKKDAEPAENTPDSRNEPEGVSNP
ncbi:MAG: HD family phosphohydrolase [Planctomycetota bacterium]|jgi:putative nucleotidyltransferase with HDIG domain